MGTWDTGPFENDAAADWCGDLEDAAPADRPGIIAMTLAADTSGSATGSPSGKAFGPASGPAAGSASGSVTGSASGAGEEVVAAAAVVAASMPGAGPVSTPYAPDYLRRGDAVPPSRETVDAAVAALDRVTGPGSQLRQRYAEGGELVAWLDGIAVLRSGLGRGVT